MCSGTVALRRRSPSVAHASRYKRSDRNRYVVACESQRSQGLAVGTFPEHPAVLMHDADRALSLLRQCGVVDYQMGVPLSPPKPAPAARCYNAKSR